MAGLKALDLMGPDVVVIPPDLRVTAVAQLLADRSVSAVPVVDADGAPLGIVTEADMISRADARLDNPPSWLTSFDADPTSAADRHARTHGLAARDVMTTSVVAVAPETPAAEVVALMERHGIRRVLVMEGGRVRGLVSSAALLRTHVAPAAEVAGMTVERIRRAVAAITMREISDDPIRAVLGQPSKRRPSAAGSAPSQRARLWNDRRSRHARCHVPASDA
jgi:CBS domain-containing protein